MTDATHPLLDETTLARYQALLDEEQALRAEHYEKPDPGKRRLKVSCNACDTPWCCNQRVDVNLVDALAVYRYASTHARAQLELVLKRARELRRRPELDDDAFFRRKIPCAFLVKGRCTVYAARPQACRSHYMAGNPQRCRDELAPRETLQMSPDPSLTAELERVATDHLFFSLVDDVEPTELSQVLLYIDTLVQKDIRWSAAGLLDWEFLAGREDNEQSAARRKHRGRR